MARAQLSPDAVTAAALAIIDDQGEGALTLAAVAERTGVAAPSLYKHVAGLADLRARVSLAVLDEITAELTAAALGRSGADAVRALLHAYRDYAVLHPARYAAVPADPLHDPRLAEAAGRQLAVILAVLRGWGIDGSDAVHTTRGLRALAHGFAHIEAAGGFGLVEDIDESFRRVGDAFVSSLEALPRTTTKETP